MQEARQLAVDVDVRQPGFGGGDGLGVGVWGMGYGVWGGGKGGVGGWVGGGQTVPPGRSKDITVDF
jgi:hypothetical protein